MPRSRWNRSPASWLAAAALALGVSAAASPDFTAAVRAAVPSVVSIVTERAVLRQPSDTLAEPMPVPSHNLGSGFVLDDSGNILTCNHVVAGYRELVVEFADGTAYRGPQVKVVGRDPVTDLAVVRVAAERRLVPARLGDSDSLQVGQWVLAMGSPFGLEGSASAGVVSGLARWGLAKSSGPDFQDFIQTDALINPGNSGGPLLDVEGRVVGVCSFTRSGQRHGFTGIGFATPANLALAVAKQLIRHGKVIRGYLGVNTQALTDGLRQALGLGTKDGVLVASVALNSPAQAAGVEPADVIVALNGAAVSDIRQFQSEIAALRPGAAVRLGLIRRQRALNVSATLAAWPVAGTEPQSAPETANWLGLVIAGGPDAGGGHGALVQSVDAASPADDAGIRPGDHIVQLNLAAIADSAAFAAARQAAAGHSAPFLCRVVRAGTAFYVAVGP